MSITTFDETDTTYSLGYADDHGTVVYHYDQAVGRACVGLAGTVAAPGSSVIPHADDEVACGQIEHDGTVAAIAVDPGADATAMRRACRGVAEMRYLVVLPDRHQQILAAFESALF